MIRITDQQFWLYAAADPQTNDLLHVRLFSTTTTALTEIFLRELRQKHDVETAVDMLEGDVRSSGHAAELEMSMYSHIDPDEVDTNAAPRDVNYQENPIFYTSDLVGRETPESTTHATMMEWWSTISETGVKGDASIATAEKGGTLLAAAVAGLHERVVTSRSIRSVRSKTNT